MIKKIIAGVCLMLSAVGYSQENNASPYSYYGIGDVKFKGTVENRSMGGLSILPDSIHVNLQNPAMYNSLKWTTYTVGASVKDTKFKTNSATDQASRGTFDYLAVAIPFKKFGAAFGILPYTSVGYKIDNNVNVDGVSYRTRFYGTGGINRAFAGASFKVLDNLSVGANFQYNFGNIETKSIRGTTGVQYPAREINDSHYGGVSFNIGASYQAKLTSKIDWITSASFTPKSKLNSTTDRSIAAISLGNNDSEIVVDELDAMTFEEDVDMPSVLTFGTGFGEARKWFAGLEYTTQSSNTLSNRFDAVTNAAFKSSQKVALGGYYIPNFSSYNSYLKRITYRGGLKYETLGLEVNGQDVNDIGFSLGLGLPLGGVGGSNINVGFEMGKRGTTKGNLVQENYMNFMVSLSLNDKWFIKRKYD